MNTGKHTQGFSLIELIIIVAVVATLWSLALPSYQDYAIRSKVAEGLTISDGLKAAVANYCKSDPARKFNSISDLGYSGDISTGDLQWVDSLSLEADCARPVFGFEISDTGAVEPPIIAVIGQKQAGEMVWECVRLAGERRHVPPACREPGV